MVPGQDLYILHMFLKCLNEKRNIVPFLPGGLGYVVLEVTKNAVGVGLILGCGVMAMYRGPTDSTSGGSQPGQ